MGEIKYRGNEIQSILDIILERELVWAKQRLEALSDVEAPPTMIEGQKKLVEELENGKIKIGGNNSLLYETYYSSEIRKGYGGSPYIVFNGGDILYYPRARYGRYIKEGNKA